jgi:PAS domain S-box-containing protein
LGRSVFVGEHQFGGGDAGDEHDGEEDPPGNRELEGAADPVAAGAAPGEARAEEDDKAADEGRNHALADAPAEAIAPHPGHLLPLEGPAEPGAQEGPEEGEGQEDRTIMSSVNHADRNVAAIENPLGGEAKQAGPRTRQDADVHAEENVFTGRSLSGISEFIRRLAVIALIILASIFPRLLLRPCLPCAEMDTTGQSEFMPSNDDVILRQLMEGLSDSVGRDFFRALTKTLARALGVSGAMVTEFDRERRTSKAIAFWSKEDGWIEDYQYSIANTPCEAVFEEKQLYHYPDHLQELFPVDHDLPNMGYISYMGVPLLETDGTVLGNLAILDRKPMPAEPRHIAIFRLFATRAAAEHQRLKMDAEIREREHKLARLFDSAMDAIIEFTPDLTITQFNRAAENTFGCSSRHTLGGSFGDLLESGSATSFQRLVTDLSELKGPGSAVWGPGRLEAKRGDGTAFAAEATVSKLDTRGSQYFTVVLRSIEQGLEFFRGKWLPVDRILIPVDNAIERIFNQPRLTP